MSENEWRKLNEGDPDLSDSHWVGIGMMLFISIAFVFLIISQGHSIEARKEADKDKFVEIEKNSLGCTRYSFNSDMVWICPDNINLNNIEVKSCSTNPATKLSDCKINYEPVIKEKRNEL